MMHKTNVNFWNILDLVIPEKKKNKTIITTFDKQYKSLICAQILNVRLNEVYSLYYPSINLQYKKRKEKQSVLHEDFIFNLYRSKIYLNAMQNEMIDTYKLFL